MDDYFGHGEAYADDQTVYPFGVAVDETWIEDLKERMKVSMEMVFRKGVDNLEDLQPNLRFLQAVTSALQHYDWKQHQHFINTFQHYRTEIEGLRIHFIRVVHPSSYKRIYPIMLLHGLESSFWEFYKVIPLLSNPDRFEFNFDVKGKIAFDVIIPSIPSLFFSEKPSRPGLGLTATARILVKLADRLSLRSYFLYSSGKMGCKLADMMALLHPHSLAGLFLINPSALHSQKLMSMSELFHYKFGISLLPESETGDNSREPEILISARLDLYGPMLLESPVGVIALILEHWASRIDPHHEIHGFSNLSSFLTMDDLLTNIVLYWSTNSLLSTFQLLKNSQQTDQLKRIVIFTPTAILINSAKRAQQWQYSGHYRNIKKFGVAKPYGELIALQYANLLAEEIFSFVQNIVK